LPGDAHQRRVARETLAALGHLVAERRKLGVDVIRAHDDPAILGEHGVRFREEPVGRHAIDHRAPNNRLRWRQLLRWCRSFACGADYGQHRRLAVSLCSFRSGHWCFT